MRAFDVIEIALDIFVSGVHFAVGDAQNLREGSKVAMAESITPAILSKS